MYLPGFLFSKYRSSLQNAHKYTWNNGSSPVYKKSQVLGSLEIKDLQGTFVKEGDYLGKNYDVVCQKY